MVEVSHATLLTELREMWQARVLAGVAEKPIRMAVLSVLAHNYDDAMPTLLAAVFPGFKSITAPFLSSAARIAKTGHIIADVVHRDGRVEKNRPIFRNSADMQSQFRRLADDLKLNDVDRQEFFAAVQRWVVADYRLDPSMDPRDPEAKRLAIH